MKLAVRNYSLFSDDTKLNVLRAIYDGYDVSNGAEKGLFKNTWEIFNSTVDDVFGEVKYGDANFDFVNTLKENNALFSVYKTHRQQNDIAQQLIGEDGKKRSFEDFTKTGGAVFDKYNGPWLETEKNTATIRARNASDFRRFEKDTDLFPNLKWLPSTSAEPRAAHVVLYAMIRPASDPVWKKHYPGNLWECKCGLTNTDEPATGIPKTNYKPDAGLGDNPAFTGSLFSASHPYVVTGYKEPKKLRNIITEAAATYTRDLSRKEVRRRMKEEFQGDIKRYKINNGPVENLSVSYQDVKNITGKPYQNNYQKNICAEYLPEVMRNAEYIGTSPDIKGEMAKGHAGVLRWHYYAFELDGKKSFITIKDTVKDGFHIHSIQDAEHFKPEKIQEKP